MECAIEVADELLGRRDDDGSARAWGLLTGLVVSYARLFTKSYAYGSLGRTWRRFPQDRRDLASMHKRLMRYRNKMLAHNDLPPHRTVVVFPSGSLLRRPFATEERSRIDMAGIEAAQELAEFQKDRMKAEADRLVQALEARHGWSPDDLVRL